MANGSPPAAAAFEIVPDHVIDAGRYVQQTAQTLVNGVRAADGDVGGLMSSWKGVAATAYLGAWDETRTAATAVLDSLETMAELLGVVAVQLPEVDSNTAAGMSTLDLPAP